MLIFPHAGMGRRIPLCMAGAHEGVAKPDAFLRGGGSSGSSLGPALNLAAIMVSYRRKVTGSIWTALSLQPGQVGGH